MGRLNQSIKYLFFALAMKTQIKILINGHINKNDLNNTGIIRKFP